MTPLRIGVNALYLLPGGVGGTEIYLRQLLRALAGIGSPHQYLVFTNRETGADLVPRSDQFEYCPQPVDAVNRASRILYEQLRLPLVLHSQQIDVLLNPGFTVPLATRIPCVTVFHDLQHARHPEHFRRFDLPFWRLLLWQAAKKSTHLIAVSEATRRDLLAYYRLSSDAVSVVTHGVEPEFLSLVRDRDEERPYILCVSTLHPHKNLDRLVRVFARLQPRHPQLRLVLAGMRGFHAEQIEKQIVDSGLAGSVELTGWIARESLYELYRRATLFIYPSTFEGFGMPVLEALGAGLPVACSDIPALHEVAGDAALFFHPEHDGEMIAALDQLLSDSSLAARYSAAGPARARLFTWPQAAQATLRCLEAAAQRSQSSS
jgi:glycosyltransferase involved in cell wall biosynthesis